MTAEEIKRDHQKDLERLRAFRLLDDDFMRKVFGGDPKYIQIVLRVVLKMPDLIVIHVETEVFVENLLKRSVRLDIVATDGNGRKFNVEIQRSDSGADSRRARYNSSMLDAFLLKKGKQFYELPETWIIFITEHDIFHKGWDVYEVERVIMRTGEQFHDGAHILYVNGKYRGNDDVGKLMHDFSCSNPDDMYNQTLAERVRFFKESREGIAIMCKVMEDMCEEYLQIGIRQGIEQGVKQGLAQGVKQGLEQGVKQGIEQGVKQGLAQGVKQGLAQGVKQGLEQGEKNGMNRMSREIALRMLKAGKYAAEEIANMSGLTMREVQGLCAAATASS